MSRSKRPSPAKTPTLPIAMLPLEELRADDRNARTHGERNLTAIRASLDAHGQIEPLIVQASTKRVLAGNGRLQVMRAMGWTHAAVVLMDVDDRTADQVAIRLNRTAELAEWDPERLVEILSDLEDQGNIQDVGFTSEELTELIDSLGQLAADAESAAGEEESEPAEVGARSVTAEFVDLVIPMTTADRALAYAALRAAKTHYKVDSSGLALVEILKAWTDGTHGE